MIQKYKILLISHDLVITGASLSLFNIAKLLQDKYEISILSYGDGNLKEEYKNLNINVDILQKNFNIKNYVKQLKNFDLVIINTVIAARFAEICRRYEIPHIWLIREATNIPNYYCANEVKPISLPKSINKNENIYVTSEYAKDFVDATYNQNVGVLHNFIVDELKECHPQQTINKEKLTFSIVGYFSKRKAQDLTIDAFLNLPQEYQNCYKLNLIGGLHESTKNVWEPLLEKTKNYPEKFNWTNEVFGEEKKKLFEETDVFLVPSLDESCSRVVLEAMMLGKPVVITPNVGAKYMVNEHTGWIVNTNDIANLKDCILNILENPEVIPDMGIYARDMYLKTSTKEIYEKNLFKIIENHLEKDYKQTIKNRLLENFYSYNTKTHKITSIAGIKIKSKTAKEPAFSIIMPTYNRAFCIEKAINSLLNQTYQNYELIIIDDGSTDGTEELLKTKYKKQFEIGKFTYQYQKNQGVCAARNNGLKLAQNEWIGYLDTDNTLEPYFLEEFRNAILEKPKTKCFYAQIIHSKLGKIGTKFNFNKLYKKNYIDLGVFIHKKSLIKRLGNFDTNLKRLVDWDLILRYTKFNKPYFIEKVILNYADDDTFNRITNSESLEPAMSIIRKKHKLHYMINNLDKIFSIKNSTDKKHKIITILHLKLKIKRKS